LLGGSRLGLNWCGFLWLSGGLSNRFRLALCSRNFFLGSGLCLSNNLMLGFGCLLMDLLLDGNGFRLLMNLLNWFLLDVLGGLFLHHWLLFFLNELLRCWLRLHLDLFLGLL